MKRLFLFISIMSICSLVFAYEIENKISLGLEITPILRWQKSYADIINKKSQEEKLTINSSADLFINIHFTDKVFLKNSIGFEKLSGNYNLTLITYTDPFGSENYETSKVKSNYKLNNLTFSFLPQYKVSNEFCFGLGTKLRFPLNNLEYKEKYTLGEQKISIKKSNLTSPNIAVLASFSYTKNRYVFSIEYDHCFNKLLEKDCFQANFINWNPRGLNFSVAYLVF